jgi:hypothetical protein
MCATGRKAGGGPPAKLAAKPPQRRTTTMNNIYAGGLGGIIAVGFLALSIIAHIRRSGEASFLAGAASLIAMVGAIAAFLDQ